MNLGNCKQTSDPLWNQNNSQSLVLLTKVAKIDEVVEGVEGVKGETKTTLDASR
jgi:hypothetical protein